MAYYIEAIRAAAAAASPRDLKPALDFLLELALADYRAGALDVIEYCAIADEYAETLKAAGAVNYL